MLSKNASRFFASERVMGMLTPTSKVDIPENPTQPSMLKAKSPNRVGVQNRARKQSAHRRPEMEAMKLPLASMMALTMPAAPVRK